MKVKVKKLIEKIQKSVEKREGSCLVENKGCDLSSKLSISDQ
ncbi:hypothetical protein [Rossellomorea sp. FS2]